MRVHVIAVANSVEGLASFKFDLGDQTSPRIGRCDSSEEDSAHGCILSPREASDLNGQEKSA